ncbi:MAG: adenylosuccinate synthase [Phycisphaerae bacterium]
MTCKNVTVIGLQWGDEGKGKIVDALAGVSQYVVRFCGGANAGHTVKVGEETFALHLIPSGVLNENVVNVIGNGVAFDPETALKEIEGLVARGIKIGPENLRISQSAHVVMPYHKMQDLESEKLLGNDKIGTTARGIGPCYSDKANRSTALRAGDLVDPELLREKLQRIVATKNKIFSALYGCEPIDADALADQYIAYGKRLAPMICDTGALIRKVCREGKDRLLFEGGQGAMLDLDHGTFPFVTSSAVTACGIPTGAGVSPKQVGNVVGLIKAYTTRVGAGPFPSEQNNENGDYLRQKGHEYGTTTGRPRRCGWFDAFLVAYTAELSGVDEMVLSLLDVLTGLDEIQICVGYERNGRRIETFDPQRMDGVDCIYETLPGWSEDITGCRSFDELPAAAQAYVNRVEELTRTPVGFISVGPERTQTIVHNTNITELAE